VYSLQYCKNRSEEVFPLPNHPCAAQHSCGSTPVHVNEARDSGDLKDKAEVGGADGQDTKEVVVAAEGEVIEVPCARSHPIQLTSGQGDATRRLDTMPARTPSSVSASQSTPTSL